MLYGICVIVGVLIGFVFGVVAEWVSSLSAEYRR